ncbi:MAG: ROK family protein [Pirellulales bacterium]|nr:ROK family protein [Pirellulales bacterium]
MSALPATLTRAADSLYAGIDVGGTNIKIGLVDDMGRTVAFQSLATESDRGPTDAAARMGATIKSLCTQCDVAPGRVARVGLATPGPLDVAAGLILCPGNLPAWHDAPIRDLVAEACGRPVTFANDANAAAYGEYWRGTGQAARCMVMLTMGTGIGGGIVVDDLLVEGRHGCGAELGHVVIDCRNDAPLNSLGIRGTLEGYCGAYGTTARAVAAVELGANTTLGQRFAQGEELTPLVVAQEAEAGDATALEIVMDTARYMALGVVTAIHAIDPDCVVIGGAATFGGAGHPLGERFLARLREETERRLIPSLRGQIEISFARLGSDAGYIGAAGLARRDALAAGDR